jgi:hypothetical protein
MFAEMIIIDVSLILSTFGKSDPQNAIHELQFVGINDLGVGSESLNGKPSENEVNLSSISLGSVGSEMNY